MPTKEERRYLSSLSNRGVNVETWQNSPVGQPSWQGQTTVTENSYVYSILGGNSLGYYTGLLGIEYQTSAFSINEADISSDLASIPTLPNGVGVGRNLSTGEYAYIIHHSDYSPNSFDLIAGQIVYAPQTVTITYADNPDNSFTGRIPALVG